MKTTRVWIIGSALLAATLPLSANFCQTYLLVNLANEPKDKSNWLDAAMPAFTITHAAEPTTVTASAPALKEESEAPLLGKTIQFNIDSNPEPFGGQSNTDWSSIKFTKEQPEE